MEFKFPKKLQIGDNLFKINYDKNTVGAEFSYPDGEEEAFITISTKEFKSNPTGFLSNVIHELKEIIQIEQSTRFTVRNDLSYKFIYDHSHHTDLCSRLTELLTHFIK